MKLKNWLKLKRWTQADLARVTGIHPRTIGHYCNGTRPNDKNIILIEQITQGAVGPRDFIGGKS